MIAREVMDILTAMFLKCSILPDDLATLGIVGRPLPS